MRCHTPRINSIILRSILLIVQLVVYRLLAGCRMCSTSMCWCILFAFALGYGYSMNDHDCAELDHLSCIELEDCDNVADSCMDYYLDLSMACMDCMCENTTETCTSGNFTCNCTSGNVSSCWLTTSTSTATSSTTETSGELTTPHYLGIATGGAILLIISILACICICTGCIIKGSKSKKLDGSGAAARLSEEGKVQLLSITEKAGVEGTDTSGSGIPEAVQAEQGPAETAADTKEDDKRVVTVATFGFPEVAILPPPATTEEENEAEAKEVVDTAEKKEVQKDANKEEGTSATDSSGPGTPATMKETHGHVKTLKDKTPEAEVPKAKVPETKVPEAKVPEAKVPDVLDRPDTQVNLEAGMELVTEDPKATATSQHSPQKMDGASLAKMDTAQVSLPKTDKISLPIAFEVESESASNPSQQHGLKPFEVGSGMESSIFSQEEIEKGLGLEISTQL